MTGKRKRALLELAKNGLKRTNCFFQKTVDIFKYSKYDVGTKREISSWQQDTKQSLFSIEDNQAEQVRGL